MMPVIEVSLPTILLRNVRILAENNGINVESFILWALAEKVGELKGMNFERAMQDDLGNLAPLIQRYPTIKKMIAHENFILHLEFQSGMEGTFDMMPLIQRLGLTQALSKPEVPKTPKFSKDGKSLCWENTVTHEEISFSTAILLDEMFLQGEQLDRNEDS
jgi:hypothetical protein